MENKLILGLVGPIASGKGTSAQYLKDQYGAETIRFSTTLREILDLLHLPHTRENTQKMFLTLADTFGQPVLSKVVSEKIQSSKNKLIVVEGIRRFADIKFLKDIPGFKLVGINAKIQTRFERIKQRKENQDDSTKTWEQFQIDHTKRTEIYIEDLMKQAHTIIDNNDTAFKGLHTQLDKLIKN